MQNSHSQHKNVVTKIGFCNSQWSMRKWKAWDITIPGKIAISGGQLVYIYINKWTRLSVCLPICFLHYFFIGSLAFKLRTNINSHNQRDQLPLPTDKKNLPICRDVANLRSNLLKESRAFLEVTELAMHLARRKQVLEHNLKRDTNHIRVDLLQMHR